MEFCAPQLAWADWLQELGPWGAHAQLRDKCRPPHTLPGQGNEAPPHAQSWGLSPWPQVGVPVLPVLGAVGHDAVAQPLPRGPPSYQQHRPVPPGEQLAKALL